MESGVTLSAANAMSVSEQVRAAFSQRTRPDKATESSDLTKDEHAALYEIFQRDWRETTAAEWERLFDVVSWLSPEAYCYYLPGIMLATIERNQPNLIASASVLFAIDRTPSIELWDDFFVARWTLFNREELEAIKAWIYWLSTFDDFMLDDTSQARILVNIDLLLAKLRE
jgi:hypothetical protein